MRTLHSGASTKDKTPHPHAVAHALRAVIDHASTLPTQKAKNDLAKELDHHLSAARTHLTNMRNYAQRDRSGSHYKSPKDEARRITSADVNAAGNVRDLLDQAKGRIKEAGMSEEKKAATAEKKKAASAQRSKEYQAKQESGAKGSSAAHADYLRDRMEAVNEAARSTPGKTREEREARGSGVELATQMYRAHLNEHKKKHGSLPAGHTMPPEHERTRQKRAESEGQQRFAFSRRVDAISALAQLSKGGEGGSHKNVKKLKKSEGAHAMIESTPSIRKSFRGLDGAQPLAKGLYKFGDYSQNAKMQAIPDEYLLAYLDAFIEEATEHEMREKAHALDAMTMGPTPGGPEHSLAQWVMNELVQYMACNANLMRAVKMCNCTKDYIADRISAMGLLKPLASHRTDHGDYLQGFMYSEEQEAGYVGKSYGPNTVLDESAMLKAVAHTRAAARAVDGSPVQFAADDPMQALGDFHRAQRARVQAYYGEGTARFDARAGEPLPKR